VTTLVNPNTWDGLVAISEAARANANDRARAWSDPEWFLRDKLQCKILAPKQIEILLSIRDHANTSVVGGNSTGKDYTTGRSVLWWLYVHDEAIVVVYGPTARQVEQIIWREARKGFEDARGALPGYMYPKAAQYEVVKDRRFAVGFSAQAGSSIENRGQGIQGFHSPHTLVIVTEAHAVEDSEIESLISLGPERFVMTGNPLVSSGEFYRSFKQLREIYNGIKISAKDTPNLIEGRTVIPGMATVESVQTWADRFGIDSPVYKARVLAEFPDNTEDSIVNLAQAEAAVVRDIPLAGEGEGILGVDVARFGDDNSVIYRRQGGHARLAYRVNGRPTTHIAGKVIEICQSDLHIDKVVVDTVGVGAGVYDLLVQQQHLIPKVKLVAFVGGAKAHRGRYVNRIAEVWWRMREAFVAGMIDIENDDALISQITTRTYELQSDAKIRLESKVKMKERGAPSPDEADALAMTFGADIGTPAKRIDRFAQTRSRHPMGFQDDRYRDTDTGEIPE